MYVANISYAQPQFSLGISPWSQKFGGTLILAAGTSRLSVSAEIYLNYNKLLKLLLKDSPKQT